MTEKKSEPAKTETTTKVAAPRKPAEKITRTDNRRNGYLETARKLRRAKKSAR